MADLSPKHARELADLLEDAAPFLSRVELGGDAGVTLEGPAERAAAILRTYAALRERLDSIDISTGDHSMPGCGNHSCIVRKPEGQGTNTSCRCSALMAGQAWRQCVDAAIAAAEEDAKHE